MLYYHIQIIAHNTLKSYIHHIQVGSQSGDYGSWGSPEDLDTSSVPRPVYTISTTEGTDLSAQAAAAMAAGAILFKKEDREYSKQLKKRAKQLWAMAKEQPYEMYSNTVTDAAGVTG